MHPEWSVGDIRNFGSEVIDSVWKRTLQFWNEPEPLFNYLALKGLEYAEGAKLELDRLTRLNDREGFDRTRAKYLQEARIEAKNVGGELDMEEHYYILRIGQSLALLTYLEWVFLTDIRGQVGALFGEYEKGLKSLTDNYFGNREFTKEYRRFISRWHGPAFDPAEELAK